MKSYEYRCFNCKTRFQPSEIEEQLLYLCPKCGKAEQNMPLKGVLLIQYDYSYLRKIYNRAFFLEIPAGQFWRYPELWPLETQPAWNEAPFYGITLNDLSALELPPHKICSRTIASNELLIMDETNNPTYSYKDRASILVALKAKQSGIHEISAASTGNAGSSLAGICARLGITANLLVPESIPEAKLMQIMAYGAQVHLVQGNYDTAFDLCTEISQKMGWYNRNTAYNPLTIEGKKSAAFDIFIETKGKLPQYIFVPVGDGVIISGLFKGFCDLKQLGIIRTIPHLIAVQSHGSDALVRYLATGKFEYQSAETIADSIAAGAPRNLYMAANAVRETGGFAVAVDDSEIVEAQKTLSEQSGFLAEPAAAAGLAGYLKIQPKLQIKQGKKVLLLLTGSGLKDLDSLKRLHRRPSALSPEILRNCFEGK